MNLPLILNTNAYLTTVISAESTYILGWDGLSSSTILNSAYNTVSLHNKLGKTKILYLLGFDTQKNAHKE